MSSLPEKPILEVLNKKHLKDDFKSGSEPLDDYLKRFALGNQKAGSARTYVIAIDNVVVGYFSLTVSHVIHAEAPARMSKGMARYPIPVMVLARLAVHQDYQGQRFGSHLLRNALERTLQVSEITGIRAVITHAKDEQAKAFYERFDFFPFSDEPLTLYRLIKDIAKVARHSS